jgi:hypothetical protein
MTEPLMAPEMSQEKQFAVGETLSLNSGGHLMTVFSMDEETITCVWSVRGDIKTKAFPARVCVLKAEGFGRGALGRDRSRCSVTRHETGRRHTGTPDRAAQAPYAFSRPCGRLFGGKLRPLRLMWRGSAPGAG